MMERKRLKPEMKVLDVQAAWPPVYVNTIRHSRRITALLSVLLLIAAVGLVFNESTVAILALSIVCAFFSGWHAHNWNVYNYIYETDQQDGDPA